MPRFMRLVFSLITTVIVLSQLNYAADNAVEYKVVATNKTSTSQKEMNEAAAAGFPSEL